MDPCFNLVDEKWVRVMRNGGQIEVVSLADALARAHEFRGLAGETPTQDVAILRLLLAVLYAALYGDSDFDSPDDAIEAWLTLWRAGQFPAESVRAYLNRWRDRFWLFHDQRPFMQVPVGRDGIAMENAANVAALDKPGKPAARGVQRASKLNGAIFESGNTDKLFNIAVGERKNSLSYAEAARWLVHVIGYDDGGIKPYYEKNSAMNQTDPLATCSVSWLGSISSVFAEGDTLFESLALNLVLLKNGTLSDESIWPCQRPTWEYDAFHQVEMMGVSQPDNPAELCTFLSRRIMLIRKADKVLGFVRFVGEAFPKADAEVEQWTLWIVPKGKRGESTLPVPRGIRLPAQMWREMDALLAGRDGNGFCPGVVRWISLLSGLNDSPLRGRLCRFRYVKAQYDVAQSSSMTEILDDSIAFSAGLLTRAGRDWVQLLEDEVALCDKVSWQIGLLAEQLMSAEGGKVSEKKDKRTATARARKQAAQDQFFHMIDLPFRRWLQELRADDNSEDRHERIQALRRTVRDAAMKCGRGMLDRVSPAAYSKRMKGQGEQHCTAPEAWLLFHRAINKCIPLESSNSLQTGGAKA